MTAVRADYETGIGGDDRMELRIWLRLLTCTNMLDRQVKIRLKKTADITLPRFDILAQLERHGAPMSMSALSERLMVSNGNVTGLVERLIREGLVERTRAPHDRRIRLIGLTAEGTRVFTALAEDHRRWIASMMAGLTQEDMGALHDLLALLKRSIREDLDQPKRDSLHEAH